MSEAGDLRYHAALLLIQLIESVAKFPDTYAQTNCALNVINAISKFTAYECSHQPPTSSPFSAGDPPETSDP